MLSWQDAIGWLVAFALLIILSFALIDRYNETANPEGAGPLTSVDIGKPKGPAGIRARVNRVVDGDTIIVRKLSDYGDPTGPLRRVRYIGVDTPESVKPDTPVQCYGKEAAAANKRLLDQKFVTIVFDEEHYDRYGRTLGYVYLDKKQMVNAALLRDGYARTIVVPPNTAKRKEFAALEKEAKRTNKGLWGACDR